jgi:Asp-tRNA(Asn)/Glu-tRNA(Gln) amidotransferase B subunit
MRQKLGVGANEIIKVVREAAKEGDMRAAEMVLNRLLPTLRAEGSLVKFEFDGKASILEQFDSLMQAVADGAITVDDAKDLVNMLRARAEIVALQGSGAEADRIAEAFKQMALSISDRDGMLPPKE